MAETHTARRRRVEFRLRVAEVIIAALVFATGLIYAGFAWWQLRTMQSQLDLQRTLQEHSERPWLVPSDFKLEGSLRSGEAIQATAVLVNAGRTPANSVRFQTSVIVTNETDPEKFEVAPNNDFESIGVIAPGITVNESVRTPFQTDDAMIEMIEKKAYKIFLYGMVTYAIPSGRGETRFCVVYLSDRNYFTPYKTGGNYAK